MSAPIASNLLAPTILLLVATGCSPAIVQLRPAKGCDGGNLEDCQTQCAGNLPRACYRLGWFYEEGQQVEENVSTAIDRYQQACDANWPKACRALGILYSTGKKVDPNREKAISYHQKACDLGLESSCIAKQQLIAAKDPAGGFSLTVNADVNVNTPSAPEGPSAPQAPSAPSLPSAPSAPPAPTPPTPTIPTPGL